MPDFFVDVMERHCTTRHTKHDKFFRANMSRGTDPLFLTPCNIILTLLNIILEGFKSPWHILFLCSSWSPKSWELAWFSFLKPSNIVFSKGKIMLHGVTNSGSKPQDMFALRQLLFCVSGGETSFDYINNESARQLCNEYLSSGSARQAKLHDLVSSLERLLHGIICTNKWKDIIY